MLDRIPDGATVAASNHLAPQLTSRAEVSVFGFPGSRPDPWWIIVDRAQHRADPSHPARRRPSSARSEHGAVARSPTRPGICR
ncbi:DUF2079 domain-containing protein [Streptomyces sp. NBC_01764]|uniref:DUF2079 domain-containing protein n=1 Tax=Streptomyces sp. NBC_01764 TaxID=2975935 RepID=UPI002B1CC3F6|nr:DUF2079 domain-containing protein [Streptomyces sp. NBC_01764]